MTLWKDCLPESLETKYEVYNFNYAVEILSNAYADNFREICSVLESFQISVRDIVSPGGSESEIPKKFSALLNPLGWTEASIRGDLLVCLKKHGSLEVEERTIENFIGGHKIDYVKGSIAFDMEWNSKDQTFDRDLYAFRSFYECGIISCGIIVTRSAELNDVFAKLDVKKKYGASTTWMGKLLPRIYSRRHGGCPLFVLGIKPTLISDWND